METCTQCKKTKTRNSEWRNYVARYHEVEIWHSVCPQCSELSFPKFYEVHEDKPNVELSKKKRGSRKHQLESGFFFRLNFWSP